MLVANRVGLALGVALAIAGCEKKQDAPPPPRPKPVARPAAPTAAFPDSCWQAIRALAPGTDSGDGRVVVVFWARWSAPDLKLIPVLEAEVARDAHRWRLIKSDIDEAPAPAQACNIRSVPTVIGFVNGAPAAQFVGLVPAARVRQFLESVSPKP